MKKFFAAFALALCVAGGASAYNVQAPNSFDDAGRGSWEFKAVQKMCEEKKSPEYDASYFKDNAHISRYELAGVIMDLLENGRGLSEEDETQLSRMKKSYRRELEARGWKEPEREREKPLMEIHGDLRVRHTKGEGNDARARVGFQYNVSDNTSIHAGGKVETD